MNVEHRTLNVQRRMGLGIQDSKFDVRFVFVRYIKAFAFHSKFKVGCSMLDVHLFIKDYMYADQN
jgi:hypothetical protein